MIRNATINAIELVAIAGFLACMAFLIGALP